MNSTLLSKIPAQGASVALAQLAEPHGYRFDGDRVHLHARLTVLGQAAHQRSWALQLWACPVAPTSAQDLAGQLVAEMALPPMSEVADDIEHIQLSAFARIPACRTEHFMVLVLATGRLGKFDEIHDLKVYPSRQHFLQPRMCGEIGYRIDGSQVRLTVERIENPRTAANLSGTLALELWALPAPHTGGAFQGVPLAGMTIGSLSGRSETKVTSFALPFSAPPAGTWHFVLMLREWTAAGYQTRDFTNFITPVSYGSTPKSAPQLPETPAPLKAAPVQPAAAAKLLAPVAPLETAANSPSKVMAAPAKSSTSRPAPEPSKAQPAPKGTAQVGSSVSVNTAPVETLAAIKGLSPQLARAIIKKRPYTAVDDLRRVKGMTVKLLASIRSRLKI
jgi:DNA uptake protein ComE-like DNA-binding protein